MSKIARSSLVVDPAAFQGGHTPPMHRDTQLRELRACYASEPTLGRPVHAWAHGPPGVGKTFCVRYLINTEVQESGALPLYINCRERFTFLGVLEQFLDTVKPLRSAQRNRERQLTILRTELSDRRVVLALDEVDVLPANDITDLLYHLSALPRTSIICISPSRLPFLGLPESIRSRLAPHQILFPRYKPEEIQAMIKRIVATGLRPGAATHQALEKIANHSYGDARRAITLLRHAVQRAEEAGARLLEPDHLVPENLTHFNPPVEEELSVLSSHHRILCDLVTAKGPIPGIDLEEEYGKVCARQGLEPVKPRTVSKYLEILSQRRILRRERGAGTAGWIYTVPGAST